MAFGTIQLIVWLAWVSGIHSSPTLPSAPRAVVIDNSTQLRRTYDYVIIGGGTSGVVVANRLTEDPTSMCFASPLSMRTTSKQLL